MTALANKLISKQRALSELDRSIYNLRGHYLHVVIGHDDNGDGKLRKCFCLSTCLVIEMATSQSLSLRWTRKSSHELESNGATKRWFACVYMLLK